MKLSKKQREALRAIEGGGVFPFDRQGNLLCYLDDFGSGSYAPSTLQALVARDLVVRAGREAVRLTPAGTAFLSNERHAGG